MTEYELKEIEECQQNAISELSNVKLFNLAHHRVPKLCEEVRRLRKALQFYASCNHLQGFENWEVPSGETNWLSPAWDGSDDIVALVETGEIARAALAETEEK